MTDIAGWIAPIATMIAAIMTAINLGPRVTGWGFIVFTVGSLAWIGVAIGSGQQNLLWTNGFLTIVNGIGIWRWLGRQAQYQDGGDMASARSRHAPVDTLFSMGALANSAVLGSNGQPIGTVVDAMARCGAQDLAYVVIRCGGVGGVGEALHAIHPAALQFGADAVRTTLTKDDIDSLPTIDAANWPVSVSVDGKLG